MSGLALEHVSKVFPDGTAAVVDFDLRVHDGECCVLVGPSGCGKSTLLRLVAGLETPTRGTILIGNEVVNDVPARERDIAMVFERSTLYPHLDVAGNIGFSLALKGEPEPQRTSQVKRAAGRVGVGRLLRRRPQELAEGERQRTALGRAMVRRPRTFLMDEPLSSLDARLRVQMRATLARLHRDLGATILLVTHDHTEAMALADRVAVMRAGRLEQVDEPRALYRRPATLFVAAFIGTPPMNLWHVRVTEEGGRVVLACGAQRLAVPAELLHGREGLGSRLGRDVILGLRPELLATTGPAAPGSVLELPVTRLEELGSHVLAHLAAEGAGLQLADAGAALPAGVSEDPEAGGAALFTRSTETLVARLPAHTEVRPGERLRLHVDLERAHVFDPSTGRALR